MVLYPFTATRMMNKAALTAYQCLKKNGTQQSLIKQMQTRKELYSYLGYHEHENKLDALFINN
jgi:methylisocitrate lyase